MVALGSGAFIIVPSLSAGSPFVHVIAHHADLQDPNVIGHHP